MQHSITNMMIEHAQLKKDVSEIKQDVAPSMSEKLDLIISMLHNVKSRELIINDTGVSVKKSQVILHEDKPFIPSISTSEGSIQAKDAETRKKKKDISKTIEKFEEIDHA